VRPAAQVSFWTVQALMDVKRELAPAVRRNRAREATTNAYAAFDAEARPGARLQVLESATVSSMKESEEPLPCHGANCLLIILHFKDKRLQALCRAW
jgi:hypothetical protein